MTGMSCGWTVLKRKLTDGSKSRVVCSTSISVIQERFTGCPRTEMSSFRSWPHWNKKTQIVHYSFVHRSIPAELPNEFRTPTISCHSFLPENPFQSRTWKQCRLSEHGKAYRYAFPCVCKIFCYRLFAASCNALIPPSFLLTFNIKLNFAIFFL